MSKLLLGTICGIVYGLLDRIITKAYAPIICLGAIGGIVGGIVVGKWGH